MQALGFLAAAALLAAGGTVHAQSNEWRMQGSVGVNLSRTTQTPLLAVPQSSSSYDSLAGNLRLGLDAWLLDPQFLPFSVHFDGERGSNSLVAGSYRNSLLNWGFTTSLLPSKSYPLRVFYNANQYGTSGNLFGQDGDTTTLGAEWRLKFRRAPKVVLGYTRFTTVNRLQTSLFSSNYGQGHLYADVQDTWKNWDWNTSFENFTNVSNFASFLALPEDAQQTQRVLGVGLHRSFWSRKADFRVDHRAQWRNDHFPGLTAGQAASPFSSSPRSNDSFTTASLNFQHTTKLSTSYFYNFTRVNTENVLQPGSFPSSVTLLLPSTFSSQSGGGGIHYSLTSHLQIFEELRYQRATPIESALESRESLAESLSGLSYHRGWKKWDLSGSYTGHFRRLGTNLGNSARNFSNDVAGRVSWGSEKSIRLAGSGGYSKINLIEQINGFAKNRRLGWEAETRKFDSFRFRLGAQWYSTEMLNIAGNLHQNSTNLTAQLEHPRYLLGFTQTWSDGFGALFPVSVQGRTFITEPLPIELLLGSPLLDRSGSARAFTLTLRLRQNLDLGGNWRTQEDLFSRSIFHARQGEVRARYRIGKIYLDAGFGLFRSVTQTNGMSTGLRTNRYLLRISRDFRVF